MQGPEVALLAASWRMARRASMCTVLTLAARRRPGVACCACCAAWCQGRSSTGSACSRESIQSMVWQPSQWHTIGACFTLCPPTPQSILHAAPRWGLLRAHGGCRAEQPTARRAKGAWHANSRVGTAAWNPTRAPTSQQGRKPQGSAKYLMEGFLQREHTAQQHRVG
jgi:hypothetical protein